MAVGPTDAARRGSWRRFLLYAVLGLAAAFVLYLLFFFTFVVAW